ncbi:MAG TPA: hypothetical protein VLW47_10695 [Thermodesulfobacteriota bacterium]|jgi:hypothetical protein|nr:hypothetical protein [Thermodesulfobacteriota bacterium]
MKLIPSPPAYRQAGIPLPSGDCVVTKRERRATRPPLSFSERRDFSYYDTVSWGEGKGEGDKNNILLTA